MPPQPPPPPPPSLKLEPLLARNLGCSRAEARRLLARDSAVRPREIAATDLPMPISVAGRTVELHDSFHLALHKPIGCVTALTDPRHPTARAYVTSAPLAAELRPIGRLDLETSGLLLWTTDGQWLHRLTHPRTALPRSYHAALSRPHQRLPVDLVLRDGHRPRIVELRELGPGEAHPALSQPPDTTALAAITIAGGAYHEIRRIFAALGSHVLGLCRVGFGRFVLPMDLQPGRWVALAKTDVV